MACKEKFVGLLTKPASTYRSYVWKHFGHPMTETPQGAREVQKDSTVCRICRTVLKYKTGNTTNMIQHLNRHHPEYSSNPATKVSESDSKPVSNPAPKQQKLKEAFQLKQKMPFNSPRSTAITNQIGKFIVTDLRPYSATQWWKSQDLKSSYVFWNPSMRYELYKSPIKDLIV